VQSGDGGAGAGPPVEGVVNGVEMVAAPPRVRCVPEVEANYELADAAIELAAAWGLVLDAWQEDVLRAGLAFRPDGRWVGGEVGQCVPRQNGKNGVTEVRQLAGLFLVREFPVLRSSDPLAVHTAHLNDTAAEAFRRLELLIESNEDLSRRVRRYSRANGKEAIEVEGGERIRYRARTKGGGRGYGGDDLYLDEAMFLPEFGYGALRPILSARPNPQIWYPGSAVDQEIHEDGVVFARVRERGIDGSDPRLVYFEWSLPFERPDEVPDDLLTDPEAWAQTNPALGARIMLETVEAEQRSMAARTFIVERLGVGDWPRTDGENDLISREMWAALEDAKSEPVGPLTFAFDVTPARSASCIAVAGRRADGLAHIEVVPHGKRKGTGWVVRRVIELIEKHGGRVICDGRGPAASLLDELEGKVQVETVNAAEHAQACGRFFDAVDQGTVRHLGQGELTAAVRGAVARPLGDAWAWSRKSSKVDISPLVACTLALHGVEDGAGGFEW
jgi:hypothetical protein